MRGQEMGAEGRRLRQGKAGQGRARRGEARREMGDGGESFEACVQSVLCIGVCNDHPTWPGLA
jgi:hypothetical protein